ncbi:GtrA family protein [Geminocystis sp. NIES-3709]|uniref:GtrA family protein n=1 Tax=Geminocystis sp. NIES-3709 TaxID=1617448 RepID=UPI000826A57F|nr:GtrA family protein [Geminocystis sp. NIES-3709]
MKKKSYYEQLIDRIYRKKQIIKFSAVGGLCLTFNLAILWILTDYFKVEDLTATIIGFFLSNLLGFLLNKYFTFKVTNTNIFKEIYKYYAVMTSSFIANLMLMFILVKILHIWVIYASLIVSVIFYVYNYLMHKNWSFK